MSQCARADAGAVTDGDRGDVAALTSAVIHAAENGGSQEADEHVATCDGFEYGTERGIGRRHGEAKCRERSDRRLGGCPIHQLQLPRAGRTSTCLGHAHDLVVVKMIIIRGGPTGLVIQPAPPQRLRAPLPALRSTPPPTDHGSWVLVSATKAHVSFLLFDDYCN